jgi:plasmid stabilization system protein ParE
MSKLRVSEHAKTDLSDIWFHIAQDNPTAASTLAPERLRVVVAPLVSTAPRIVP